MSNHIDSARIQQVQESLGHKIRMIRTEKRITQVELSSSTGLTSQFLSNIERGRSHCSWGALLTIADALGITLGDLIDGIPGLEKTVSHDVIEGTL